MQPYIPQNSFQAQNQASNMMNTCQSLVNQAQSFNSNMNKDDSTKQPLIQQSLLLTLDPNATLQRNLNTTQSYTNDQGDFYTPPSNGGANEQLKSNPQPSTPKVTAIDAFDKDDDHFAEFSSSQNQKNKPEIIENQDDANTAVSITGQDKNHSSQEKMRAYRRSNERFKQNNYQRGGRDHIQNEGHMKTSFKQDGQRVNNANFNRNNFTREKKPTRSRSRTPQNARCANCQCHIRDREYYQQRDRRYNNDNFKRGPNYEHDDRVGRGQYHQDQPYYRERRRSRSFDTINNGPGNYRSKDQLIQNDFHVSPKKDYHKDNYHFQQQSYGRNEIRHENRELQIVLQNQYNAPLNSVGNVNKVRPEINGIKHQQDSGKGYNPKDRSSRSIERDFDDGKHKGIENPGNNVYVAGIPRRVNEEDLRRVFSKYGSILDVKVIRDLVTKNSRGFAYVLYERVGDADRAIEGLDNAKVFNDWALKVERAKRSRPHDLRDDQNFPMEQNDFPNDIRGSHNKGKDFHNQRYSRSRSHERRNYKHNDGGNNRGKEYHKY